MSQRCSAYSITSSDCLNFVSWVFVENIDEKQVYNHTLKSHIMQDYRWYVADVVCS